MQIPGALYIFCACLGDNPSLRTFLGVHFLQPSVFVLQLLQSPHQRRVHAAELEVPLLERGVADAALPAQCGNRGATLGLLEDGDDLAVGKAGSLHAELSKIRLENSTFKHFFCGGITGAHYTVSAGLLGI